MTAEEARAIAEDLERAAAALERHAEDCERAVAGEKSAPKLWRLLAEAQLARIRAGELLALAQRLCEEAAKNAG